MIHLIAFAVLAQTTTTQNYVSPPLDWLDDQRIHWDLRKSGFTISAQTGNEIYGRRYMEYQLDSVSKSIAPPRLDGQFNCWSRPRLEVLGILDKARAAILKHSKHLVFSEEDGDASCLIRSKAKGYFLYVQISTGKPLTKSDRVRVRRMLNKIELK